MSQKTTKKDSEIVAKEISGLSEQSAIPCCPKLETEEACCEVLTYHYRLLQRRNVPVEIIIRSRFERCPGPQAMGDLVYTTTLLPGEKVKLSTTDRRTRFTFDSATKVSYRNEQTSEEHFYMASVNDFMSDISVRDSSRSTNTNQGSAQGHAETSGLLSSIFGSPSVDVSGSYSNQSTSDFIRELSEHARASHYRSEMGARATSSMSIGEVQTRTHTAAESQDHFESSSREFSNPNKCHAITFFFYRVNKMQTIKFSIDGIERRVIDPAADTKVTNNAFVSRGDVSVLPSGVLATDKDRLRIEEIGRESAVAQQTGAVPVGSLAAQAAHQRTFFASVSPTVEPLSEPTRRQALEQVDKELVAAGLLDKVGGVISPQLQENSSFEIRGCLPTPGVFVKGCLDDCNVCEPTVMKEIELDLEHKRLENELLKRQTELLEKSQEYRCCPAGSAPTP